MDIHIKLTIDDRLVTAGRWVTRRVTRKRAALVLAVGTLGAAVVMAAPVSRPHDFEAGDPIKASEINENFDELYDELNARVVRNDTTIEVADCEALRLALTGLQDRRIVASATVTLELPEGTFDCGDNSIVIDHPDGSHIEIVGAGRAETKLQIFIKDGVVVPMSRSLGGLDKLTLEGSGGVGDGLVVKGGASASIGPDLAIREFVNGVYVDGGFLRADGVRSEGNSKTGFAIASGGTLVAVNARATDNAGSGFVAFLGATIFADGAISEDNLGFGFNANNGGDIYGDGMRTSYGVHGFDANNNSTITALNAVVNGGRPESEYGFAAWNDSCIDADGAVVNDQTLEGFSSRHGSFIAVTDPDGNDVTYMPSTSFEPTERSQIFVFP